MAPWVDASHIGLGEVLIGLVLVLFITEVIASEIYRLFFALLGSSASSKIKFAPDEIRRTEIAFVLFVLVARQVGQVVGLWPCYDIVVDDARANGDAKAKAKGKSKTKETQNAGEEGTKLKIKGEQLSTSMPLKITKELVMGFHEAINILDIDLTQSDGLTMLFLSAISEPAQLLLLAKRQCPIRPLGAVNVRNRFEMLEPETCRMLCDGRLKEGSITARLSEEVKPRKRGLEFDLVVEVFADEKETRQPAFRQIFTVLQFQTHKHQLSGEEAKGYRLMDLDPKAEALIQQPALEMIKRDPSDWAKLCKDYNPIHIFWLAAKLFGQPSRIAHGNHVAAKAMAMTNLADDNETRPQSAWMEVYFNRPVQVPVKDLQVELRPGSSKYSTTGVTVTKAQKVYVDMRIGWNESSSS